MRSRYDLLAAVHQLFVDGEDQNRNRYVRRAVHHFTPFLSFARARTNV